MEKNIYGYVYLIVDNLTYRTYIGQHRFSKRQACWLEDSYMGSGLHLKNAQKKYGIEHFEKFLIQYCYSEEELDKQELFWIKRYKSLGKAEYNIHIRAYYNHNRPSPKERSIKALVDWTKKYGHSEEWKKEISQKLKGHKDFTTPEGIEKMRKSIKARYDAGFKVWNKRRTKCVETGEVFESQRAAAKHYDIAPSALCHVVNKPNKTSCGYHWIWED